jgi:hypothetical protein
VTIDIAKPVTEAGDWVGGSQRSAFRGLSCALAKSSRAAPKADMRAPIASRAQALHEACESDH